MQIEPDIFTVFGEYTSKNGNRWVCIAKQNGFAWLKSTGNNNGTAYVWREDGKSQSLNEDYDIQPEPVVETVTFEAFKRGGRTYWSLNDPMSEADKADSDYRITFQEIDGEPDCDSVKMERINA